ncbi:MAG: ABC transporter permease [Verrucomicrobiales bacterium]|nr:ABC transporter permease [Verrucomicrobiales bacterium]
MKRILLLGHHDIRLFLRQKVSFVWLLGVPLLFSFFMGFANRGPGSPRNPAPSVLIENLDEGGLGALLVRGIEAQGLNALGAERAREAERGIRIPASFTASVQRRAPVKVDFFKTEGSGDPAAAMIEARLFRALVAFNSALAEGAIEGGDSILTNPAALGAILDRPRPVRLETRFAGRKPVPVGFNQSLPGVLVMFLMMNGLIFGGAALAGERQSGVLRRLVVHPVQRHELVLGKIYGRFLLAGFQALVLLLVGRFALGVPVFDQPAGMLLVVVSYGWTCAAGGVLIGASATNPDKVIGLCILCSLLMAAIGGCWWPVEIGPAWMRTLALTVPTGWGMAALHGLITFGGSVAEIGFELLMLTLFGAAATVGAWRLLRY